MAESPEYHLVLARPAYERVVPELLRHPGRWALGRARWNPCGPVTELLVAELQIANEIAPTAVSGRDEWVALVCPGSGQPPDPRSWLVRLPVPPRQVLAVGLLGLGDQRQGWDGIVCSGRELQPVAALRIVGPRMLCARRTAADSPPAAPDNVERWSRTRGALGDEVWRKVRQSRVAVWGASRTGSALAYMLAALGVERLVLVDPDLLEEHNLDAMLAVTPEDIGRPKVTALARRLTRFRPDLAVHALACSVVDPRAVELSRGVDLVATCVDSDVPRLAAAAVLAARYLRIHLDVGTSVTAGAAGGRSITGDVRLLLPGQGCACCVGGLADEERARYELLAPPGVLRRGRPGSWQAQRLGSVITINTLCVSVAVQLYLDLLAGHIATSHWSRLQWDPGRGLRTIDGPVAAAADRVYCHEGLEGQPGL